MVEGSALYLDQRVVRAFEGQAVADVFVNEGQPAERVWRYCQLQSPPVGQMHELVPWLDQRGEQRASLALEGSKIGEFRKAAGFAQAIEDFAQRGLTGEPCLLNSPQGGKGIVEERQLSVGTKDGDRGVDAFEHVGMRVDVAPQLGSRGFDIGAVTGEADRPAGGAWRLDEIEQPALPADHDMGLFRT
jgi:hypothetical protein